MIVRHAEHGSTAMKMKIPNPNGSGNGYYGQESGIIPYADNSSDTEAEVQGIGDGDFSEYLWMENEEEFDKQVSYARLYLLPGTVSCRLAYLLDCGTGAPAVGGGGTDGRVLGGNVGGGTAASAEHEFYRMVHCYRGLR